MVKSLRALLTEILDYAGLFPPASLSLDEALKKFAAYRQIDQSWMLSHFVCPASILPGVDAYGAVLFADSTRMWRFSVVCQGGDDLQSFLETLQQDLRGITSFAEQHAKTATVDRLEIKVPSAVLQAGQEPLSELIERSAEMIASTTPGITPFYEISAIEDGAEEVYAALEALKKFNDRWSGERYRAAGAKIRTGGAEPRMIPSTKQVAFFISACHKLRLAFKATAGLHHPFSRHDDKLNCQLHGFLSVFVAAVLVDVLGIDLQTSLKIIECGKRGEFNFEQEGFTWGKWKASADQITMARNNFAISFGSCSVIEPIEDLQKFKLL